MRDEDVPQADGAGSSERQIASWEVQERKEKSEDVSAASVLTFFGGGYICPNPNPL